MTIPSTTTSHSELRFAHLELVVDRAQMFETGADAVRLFQETRMHLSPQETFYALTYGSGQRVATVFEVARGSYANVNLHAPSLLSGVLMSGVERFRLAHNHPGGDPRPSTHDIELTNMVMEAANACGLYFEDHYILVPDGRSYSFAVNKRLLLADDSPYAQ